MRSDRRRFGNDRLAERADNRKFRIAGALLAKENAMIFRLDSVFHGIAAVFRFAWWGLRGYRILATEAESEARSEHCYDCPELTESDQCRRCTCFRATKVVLTSAQCPLKKWLAMRA